MPEEILEEELKNVREGKGTRAVQVMKVEKELFRIYNDTKEVHTVNVRNNGAISSLPEDAVIEVNYIMGSFGARPLAIGRLDDRINGLIQSAKKSLTIY